MTGKLDKLLHWLKCSESKKKAQRREGALPHKALQGLHPQVLTDKAGAPADYGQGVVGPPGADGGDPHGVLLGSQPPTGESLSSSSSSLQGHTPGLTPGLLALKAAAAAGHKEVVCVHPSLPHGGSNSSPLLQHHTTQQVNSGGLNCISALSSIASSLDHNTVGAAGSVSVPIMELLPQVTQQALGGCSVSGHSSPNNISYDALCSEWNDECTQPAAAPPAAARTPSNTSTRSGSGPLRQREGSLQGPDSPQQPTTAHDMPSMDTIITAPLSPPPSLETYIELPPPVDPEPVLHPAELAFQLPQASQPRNMLQPQLHFDPLQPPSAQLHLKPGMYRHGSPTPGSPLSFSSPLQSPVPSPLHPDRRQPLPPPAAPPQLPQPKLHVELRPRGRGGGPVGPRSRHNLATQGSSGDPQPAQSPSPCSSPHDSSAARSADLVISEAETADDYQDNVLLSMLYSNAILVGGDDPNSGDAAGSSLMRGSKQGPGGGSPSTESLDGVMVPFSLLDPDNCIMPQGEPQLAMPQEGHGQAEGSSSPTAPLAWPVQLQQDVDPPKSAPDLSSLTFSSAASSATPRLMAVSIGGRVVDVPPVSVSDVGFRSSRGPAGRPGPGGAAAAQGGQWVQSQPLPTTQGGFSRDSRSTGISAPLLTGPSGRNRYTRASFCSILSSTQDLNSIAEEEGEDDDEADSRGGAGSGKLPHKELRHQYSSPGT